MYMRNMKNEYEVLIRKPQWKKPLRRHRFNRKDNIKMNLREAERGLGSLCRF
jgi:hypothetical protein